MLTSVHTPPDAEQHPDAGLHLPLKARGGLAESRPVQVPNCERNWE